MTWDDVRALHAAGMEVGGHTITHPVLATLDAAAQRAEIAGSLDRLRTELDVPVETFAYPVGAKDSVDDATTAIMADLGVRRAYGFCGGINPPGFTDRYLVRRVGVFGESPEIIRATAALPTLFGSPRRYA